MAASNWVGGTTGNDNLAGGPGRDYIFGDLGDDRLSGAGGDDILVGDNSKFAGWYADDPPLTSKDHLDGGAGNDILIGGGDDDVLIGGAGRDVFVLDGIGTTGDDGSNYDFGLGSGRDIAVDFVHGQDRIAIAVEDDVPVGDLGEPGSNVVNYYGFADFDTTGDGRLTGADGDHVTVENITYGGQTKLSTVLHYGGDLVVFGDTALTPADFTETGQDPATRFFWAGPHLPIFASFDADQLTGTAADDGIVGFAGNDVIDAGAGNDAVYAGTGDDLVHGGVGNDSIEGASGADRLFGDGGDDTITGDLGNDVLYGGTGDDNLYGGAGYADADGADQLFGDAGRDVLNGGHDDDYLVGGDGDDFLIGAGGRDLLLGGAGNDVLLGDAFLESDQPGRGDVNARDRLYGGDGNDILDGGSGNDVLVGGTGRDVFLIESLPYYFYPAGDAAKSAPYGITTIVDFTKGDDRLGLRTIVNDIQPQVVTFAQLDRNGDGVLTGADGPNVRIDDFTQAGVTKASTVLAIGEGDVRASAVLFGVTGLHSSDFLPGGSTEDNLGFIDNYYNGRPEFGTFDGDRLVGGQGSDVIRALAGDDIVHGAGGDDTIFAGSGADTVYGDDGNDLLIGGSGNDVLDGGSGDDSLGGGLGDDVLYGGSGDDSLSGDLGYDRLFGGDGNDNLATSNGVNLLTGGVGADTFTVDVKGSGRSVVADFFHGEDHLDFTSFSDTSKVPTTFAGLDGNHDGVLNGADRGFSMQNVHLGSDAASSLVFDATRFVGAGDLHLTLFGVAELRPADSAT